MGSVVGSVAVVLLLSACSGPVVAHDWGVVDIRDDSFDIQIAVGSSSCNRLEKVDVQETATEVRVTALVRGPRPFQDCTADMGFSPATIQVALGGRTLTGCLLGEGFFDGVTPRTSCADVVRFP